MKKVNGDLIRMAMDGEFDVIIHGCNCFCTMGAGIAKSIKEHFPEAYMSDLKTVKGDKSKLGSFSFAKHEIGNKELTIINAYTQFHWKGSGTKADYDAIRGVFSQIKDRYSGRRIGYPKIGAGLAGGDWTLISRIITEELAGENHTLVVYELA